jgi:hypothetical protein
MGHSALRAVQLRYLHAIVRAFLLKAFLDAAANKNNQKEFANATRRPVRDTEIADSIRRFQKIILKIRIEMPLHRKLLFFKWI